MPLAPALPAAVTIAPTFSVAVRRGSSNRWAYLCVDRRADVAQQCANHRKRQPCAGEVRSIGVPQIMHAHAVHAGLSCRSMPRTASGPFVASLPRRPGNSAGPSDFVMHPGQELPRRAPTRGCGAACSAWSWRRVSPIRLFSGQTAPSRAQYFAASRAGQQKQPHDVGAGLIGVRIQCGYQPPEFGGAR